MVRDRLILLLFVPLVTGCEPSRITETPSARATGPGNGNPSLILFNGVVITMDPVSHVEQALALHGDRITRVGSDDQVFKMAKSWTTLVDLQGATVLPGIVDAHSHLFNDAWRLDLDLEGAQELALENGITTLANLFKPRIVRRGDAGFRGLGNPPYPHQSVFDLHGQLWRPSGGLVESSSTHTQLRIARWR